MLSRVHAFLALVVTLLLPFTYYPSNCTYSSDIGAGNCLAFRFSAARLGNQMFRIMSGYSIAKQLNRKLCFNLRGYGDEANVRRTLAKIAMAFPRTFLIYTVVTSDVEKALVPFAYDAKGRRVCCVFEDPLRYINHTAKFLVLDTEYGQNVRYIEKSLADIRDLLTFSDDVRRAGEKIIESWKLAHASTFCIHTRRTDFELYHAATEVNETVKAALELSRNHELTLFLLFGDDQQFMVNLATRLSEYQEKIVDSFFHVVCVEALPILSSALLMKKMRRVQAVLVSHANEFVEFYISSRVCAAFLISAPVSTFGWWLAFFALNQEAIYYINNNRSLFRKRATKEFFLAWSADSQSAFAICCGLLDEEL